MRPVEGTKQARYSSALVPHESKAIFTQDGASTKTAKETQGWDPDSLSSFSARGIWPGNSSDVGQLGNLLAILQEKIVE